MTDGLNPPKAMHIFFDLDGTLVDSFPGIEHSALTAIGAILPERATAIPDLRRLIGPPVRKIFATALPGLDVATLDILERTFRQHYNTEGWRQTFAQPGAVATLAALRARGHTLYVLTNKPFIPARAILDDLALAPYLSGIITPDSSTPPFPTKTAAALAARDRLTPPAALVVGDAVDDAEAAAACGFRFCAVTCGYGQPHLSCGYPVHFRINALIELLNCLD
ncbi:hypothetical protein OPIT5_24140 [Opitutaceae bacterium TAV5]|nr:hypothetical protein OPIT5_24140 [Opitutaceae bacterium TAV5]